ncbi:ABC-2 transporter permease [uncultured Subdoligranulum sp.]|uniref:ABC-2 transporter permease n=1 Tax=uncultured Subdoligranulum sp. TaxID=512298 RepID=UPI0025E53BCA|nr:ABC-2 transporter permease [uncultured Subdoligranulum sp.]
MIGLLRKDQTLLWTTYNKNFLVVLLCYTAMIFASDSLIFVMYALIFLGGLYVSSTLTLDEQSQWDTYARTLPVTAAQIVGSKYLLSVAWTLICFLLSQSLCSLSGLARGNLADQWHNYLAGNLAATALVFLYNALTLPLSYKFGAAKARSVTIMATGVLVGVSVLGIGQLLRTSDAEQINLIPVDSALGVFLVLLAFLAVSLVLFFISWLVSTAIYRNKVR